MSTASQVSKVTVESQAVCGIFSEPGAPGEPTDMLRLQEAHQGDSVKVLLRNSQKIRNPKPKPTKNPSKKHMFWLSLGLE